MTAPRILVRDKVADRTREAEPAPELGWYLLGGLGVVFALVGGMDILLAWYPPNFGNMEWKFGTVTTTLNSFPLVSLGLILLLVSGLARGRKLVVTGMVAVIILVVLLILACAVLYLPEISTALNSVTDPTIRIGLKRSIQKTTVQLVIYPLVLTWIAVMSWKHWRSR